MIYWFAVDPERPEILDVGIRNGIWGVPEDAWERIGPLEIGDAILLYHRDHGLLLCEVESDPYTEKIPVWRDVDYPHRVRISDPVEVDRYAHLGQLYGCLQDRRSDEPFATVHEAEDALRGPDGMFRPLSDEEIRCVFGQVGWSLPEGLAPRDTEEGASGAPDEEADRPATIVGDDPDREEDDVEVEERAPVADGEGPAFDGDVRACSSSPGD